MIRSPRNVTIRRGYEAWSWIVLWCLQVEWIVECAWFDVRAVGLISNLIQGESPLWFEQVGIGLDEQWNSCELLEMTLYFGRVSVVFFSLSVLSFSYEKPLFIGNSIIFNLEFSLSIYWELIMDLIWYPI